MPRVVRRTTAQPRQSAAGRPLRAHLDALLVDARRLMLKGTSRPQVVLKQLLNESPFAALVANDVGVLVFANRAASELTGYAIAELRGMSFLQLTPGVREHEADVLWRAFVDRSEQSGNYELLAKGGRIIATVYAARTHFLPGLHLSLLRIPRE